MAETALQLRRLEADLDPVELSRKRFRLRVRSGQLALSPRGLSLVLPPLVELERLEASLAFVRVRAGGLSIPLQVRPFVTPAGRIGLDLGGFVGFLAGLFSNFVREQLAGKPGLHVVSGSRLEIDLNELLEPAGVSLPPLREARFGPGGVELEF